MKLRSLTLTNVRKFGGQTATINGIGDGVTVISEANEFGKSTFFDALHALFFVKYSTAGKEVKSLQPRSGGAVRVQAELETETGRFVIEKSFLAQKRATVSRADNGTLIAQDDEAEKWIAALMDRGLEGPAGLLWVRQGTTALEPAGSAGADKTEKEKLLGARRDLLSSVAGEIDKVTGGRRMDRVLARCREELAKLATASGKAKAHGPWDAEQKEIMVLEAREAELDAKCKELSKALSDRKTTEAELKNWGQVAAKEERQAALEQARDTHAHALAHADKCTGAKGDFDLKSLQHSNAVKGLNDLLKAAEALKQAADAEAKLRSQLQEQDADVAAAKAEEQVAQADLTVALKALQDLRAQRDAAQLAELGRNAREQVARLAQRLEKAEKHREKLEEAQARLAGMAITQEVLDKIIRSHGQLQQAKATADAQNVTLSVIYDGAARISLGGGELSENTPIPLYSKQEIALPGIGRLTVDPGARADEDSGRKAVEKAQAALDIALAAAQVVSLDRAHQAYAARRDAEHQVELAKGVIDTVVPEGLDALRGALAQARATAGDQDSDVSAEPVDLAEMTTALAAADDAAELARTRYDRNRDNLGRLRETYAQTRAELATAEATLAQAKGVYGDVETFPERRDAAARQVSVCEISLKDAAEVLEGLTANAPDLDTTKADLKRAETVVEQADKRIRSLQSQLVETNAKIRARAEDGVEEALAETRGQLDMARAREGRYSREVAALNLLVGELEGRRTQAREVYFEPVQRELQPLLSILHEDAALNFNPERLLPDGLARSGQQEDLEELSGGTQEQIAILTRLAFARLFASQGHAMPIILDDALVYSDDDRIVKMFTALHRVAADQQVIVFSCRQMAFAKLGGERPDVTVATIA